ncbi:MAG: L,D-transpeptidase [Nitrospirae bacterium]|nr:L,D-transpeptidase [Nitrospirota bacterium]
MPIYAGEGLIENDIVYTTLRGDYGGVIEGKIGLSWEYIASANSVNPRAHLKAGQKLMVKFKRIIPMKIEDGIVINIPDRTLYRFVEGRLKDYYFITVGKPTWQTPLGDFTITIKAKDPTWHVPLSIQKEMEAEGKDVLIEVPLGPENPLGKYWMQLSIPGVGLHSTNAPHSIYKFNSHGCMRLRPEVAEFLFKDIAVGTKGKIIYEPIKIIKTLEGRVLIEVYKDFYKKGINYSDRIGAKLKELNAVDRVDWNKVKVVIEKKDGLVWDVTLGQR